MLSETIGCDSKHRGASHRRNAGQVTIGSSGVLLGVGETKCPRSRKDKNRGFPAEKIASSSRISF